MAVRDAVGGIGPHGKAMGGRAAETGVGLAKGRWKRGRANEGGREQCTPNGVENSLGMCTCDLLGSGTIMIHEQS